MVGRAAKPLPGSDYSPLGSGVASAQEGTRGAAGRDLFLNSSGNKVFALQ